MPQARQREQHGRAFEHLTFARKQPSHDARSRGWRGFPFGVMLARECLWGSSPAVVM
jgi:hypothetical protein